MTNNNDNYDNVFSYRHFLDALKKCNKGVSYKGSVQLYDILCLERIEKSKRFLDKCQLPPIGNMEQVVIRERGKQRIITPVKISDRMVQRVLCDNALTPVINKHLIFDNCASIKNKGTSFARNRLLKKIVQANREYKNKYYVLVFDFKNFFDSIRHSQCRKVLNSYFSDKRIVNMAMDIIHSYSLRKALKDGNIEDYNEILNDNGVGICLGSQVSQIMALTIPNKLDHYIKDNMRERYYIRYMDDGVIFSKTKEHLKKLLIGIEGVSESIGLELNHRKTHISKVSNGFKFLKIHYVIKPSGKIIKKLDKSSSVRMVRKLKKYKNLVKDNLMTKDDVFASVQSWLGYIKIANSYRVRRRIIALYSKLFGGYRITNEWSRKRGVKTSNELLQNNK